jgi:hypothetical protein
MAEPGLLNVKAALAAWLAACAKAGCQMLLLLASYERN